MRGSAVSLLRWWTLVVSILSISSGRDARSRLRPTKFTPIVEQGPCQNMIFSKDRTAIFSLHVERVGSSILATCLHNGCNRKNGEGAGAEGVHVAPREDPSDGDPPLSHSDGVQRQKGLDGLLCDLGPSGSASEDLVKVFEKFAASERHGPGVENRGSGGLAQVDTEKGCMRNSIMLCLCKDPGTHRRYTTSCSFFDRAHTSPCCRTFDPSVPAQPDRDEQRV